MDDLLAGPLATPGLGILLMSTFGLVALLLAAIGLYGVMTALVRGQTRELGIRMALGATSAVVRRGVLRRAMALTLTGAAADLVLLVGTIAAFIPARRATNIDPLRALRSD